MITISPEELRKIARISQIAIEPHEQDAIAHQLEAVLSYAQRVQEVAGDFQEFQPCTTTNVFRDDIVVSTSPEPILAQAPDQQEGYFVVPRILDHNER